MNTINFEDYLSTTDIIKKLDVSKDWINKNIRPHFSPVQLKDANENSCAIKTQNNLIWYQKDALYAHLISNIKVYSRANSDGNNERARGKEIETTMPVELLIEIQDDKFQFINIKAVMQHKHFNNYEMAYRWLYKKQAYSVKLLGKTYYFSKESPLNFQKK